MNVLKRKGLFFAMMLACLSLAPYNLMAQKKTLITSEDGFKWYKLQQNGKEGVLSLKDVTIIPLSRAYTSIQYHATDGGWFGIEKNGKKGACNKKGREIIPPKYKSVVYSSDENVFECKDDSGKWITIDISLEDSNDTKPTHSSPTSGSASTLLYQGVYRIQGTKAKDIINGYEVSSDFDATEKVEIYEDKLTIYFGTQCKYKSTNEDGERIYEGKGTVDGGLVKVYVSPSYKIRLTSESKVNGKHMLIEIPVVKGRSLMQNVRPDSPKSGVSSGYSSENKTD